jgi:hypothetical protein
MIFIIGTFLILALIGFAVLGLSVLWFTVIAAAALGLTVVWFTVIAAFTFVPLVPPEIWGILAALTIFLALIASTHASSGKYDIKDELDRHKRERDFKRAR